MNDFENRLRASLHEQARRAPDGDALAEEIIAGTQRSPELVHRPNRWRTWTFPLVTAGAVAAVAAALVGVSQVHHTATPPATYLPTVQVPTVVAPTPHPSPTEVHPTTTPTVTDPSGLSHFQAIDMTFVGTQLGWALGSAECLDGSGNPCAAMVYTRDGGASWHSMKQPPGASIPLLTCADACLQHIRFATPLIGYAFGPSTLFMTRNGGQSWTRETGGADALETLDGNVIRLVSDHSGCPGPCNLRIEHADIGSDKWVAGVLDSRQIDVVGVSLVRSGSNAVVETTIGQAASLYHVVLYTSADDGQTWKMRVDPCSTVGADAAGRPMASTSLAAGGDGSISVLCQPGGQGGDAVTVTSTDGGASFVAGRLHYFGCCGAGYLGAASVQDLVVVGDPLSRSTDGGASWHTVSGPSLNSNPTFVGFESQTVGRIASDAGRTIWTTHDAGAHWMPYTFK